MRTTKAPPAPRRALKLAAVADLLDCDIGSVRGAIERGELPAIRFGRRMVRVPSEVVHALLQRGNVGREVA